MLVTRRISLDTVREAANHVYRAAIRTPLVRVDVPGPTELYLKLENLQPIGSFKIRGAYNAVRQLTAEELGQGVWTISAGNAGQGVALAARLSGARCAVLAIETAPRAKLDAMARLGAEIVTASYDECWQALIDRRSDRMHGHFVHPFDDDQFISGNATLALEILEDLPDVSAVVAALGGGGLVSGIGCVMHASRPGVNVFAAEPETAAPFAYSLAAGAPSYFPDWRASFVDGAGGHSVLTSMWPLLREWTEGSIVVSLEEARRAMRLAAERARVIAEGAAACAIAAALKPEAGGGKVVAVVSGGNIDLHKYSELMNE